MVEIKLSWEKNQKFIKIMKLMPKIKSYIYENYLKY